MTNQASEGRVALVTGGAGGIGTAVCHALASAGARVVVGYNGSERNAHRLAESLAGEGHTALKAPVTDSTGLQELAQVIVSRYGRLDILVNGAGTTRFVPHPDLDALDDELINTILSVNVRGVIATTRAMRPMLQASGDGVVINISSIAAVTAMGSNIAYCASKAAVDNLTKSLARALAPAIRVISVSPGLVDTEFVKQLDQSWRNKQAALTPLDRLCQPEDVAEAILAAVSLRFTTGAIIPVDGGRPLS